MTRKGGNLSQVIDGDLYSSYFDPNLVREALRFTPGKGDIVQATYPASGTHWMLQMTQLIVYKGRSASSYREFGSRYEFLELVGKPAAAASTTTPRLLATHIRPGKIAASPEAKYVYVARNPWDVCASLYELQGQLRGPDDRQTWDDFVTLFWEGLAGTGDYFEHVHSGYLRKGDPNVFFVTYEEMAADPGDVVMQSRRLSR
ncbi:hypothetical protein HPB52_006338 [Rhipicephalus sanguineus]|uniref:Sulfotransferase domain-containing protein n=1 Tax=Rhipicephalus sanguineus TaxID=34632 RepID=A0A9D4T3G9_RHISA|nr:hypothetical protein HPB52_006338 [Rhipicephalus sanguineus]